MIHHSIDKNEINDKRKEYLELRSISFQVFMKDFLSNKKILFLILILFLAFLTYLIYGVLLFVYFKDIFTGILFILNGFLLLIWFILLLITFWLKRRGKIPISIRINRIFYRMRLLYLLGFVLFILLFLPGIEQRIGIFVFTYVFQFVILFLSVTSVLFSVSHKRYRNQSFHKFFLKHPFLDELENRKITENLLSFVNSADNFIPLMNRIFDFFEEFVEFYLYPTIRTNIKNEDLHRFYLAILKEEEIILNSFSETIKELNLGNFKEFYISFHSFVQLLRSDNLEQPIKSFVFKHKRKLHIRFLAMITKFLSNGIVTGIIVGIILIIPTIYITRIFA